MSDNSRMNESSDTSQMNESRQSIGMTLRPRRSVLSDITNSLSQGFNSFRKTATTKKKRSLVS